MDEEKIGHGRVKHHVVRGVESLAVVSLLLVPVVRRMRARRQKKHVFELRRYLIVGR